MYLNTLSLFMNGIIIIEFVLILLWLYSEIWIAKDSKNKKELNTTVWLIINFLLPFLGLLLYKISSKTLDDNR